MLKYIEEAGMRTTLAGQSIGDFGLGSEETRTRKSGKGI